MNSNTKKYQLSSWYFLTHAHWCFLKRQKITENIHTLLIYFAKCQLLTICYNVNGTIERRKNTLFECAHTPRSRNNIMSERDRMSFICKARKGFWNWSILHCGIAEQRKQLFFGHLQRVLEEFSWFKSRFWLSTQLVFFLASLAQVGFAASAINKCHR